MNTQALIELEAAIAALRLPNVPYRSEEEKERLEELQQEYESLLTLLESKFLAALVGGDWREFDRFINDLREEN